MQLFGMHK
jgi:hypothetical protein